MHTVRQLADLSGITVRTLHHYDAIGLLKPTQVGFNRYRYYDGAALMSLQQILLYRELGLSLKEIQRLLGKQDFSVVKALESHRRALTQRIRRLETLVGTVEKTIEALQGGQQMSDEQVFEGLTAKEKEYAEEALSRWDPTTVRESHRRWNRLTAEQKAQKKVEADALNREWVGLLGTDPAGPRARALVERWREGVEFFYPASPETLVGLARMYGEDPRFKQTYDRFDPRLAGYIRTCVEAYFALESRNAPYPY